MRETTTPFKCCNMESRVKAELRKAMAIELDLQAIATIRLDREPWHRQQEHRFKLDAMLVNDAGISGVVIGKDSMEVVCARSGPSEYGVDRVDCGYCVSKLRHVRRDNLISFGVRRW